MSARKICVVTGSRAEYGLLSPLMRALAEAPGFQLQVVATGAHLAPEFGLTYRVIEQDGFQLDAKVEMLLSSDTLAGSAKSLGIGVIGMTEAFERLRPEIVVVLGDRYEILAAATAAMMLRLPVAHIAGGDTTEGAVDESIRHAITKMSHVHFVTNEESAERVRRMGEDPARVINTGSPGLDAIRMTKLLDRAALEQALGARLRKRNLLVTFHPVTLAGDLGMGEFEELLKALGTLGTDFGIFCTRQNADAAGRQMIKRLNDFVSKHENANAYTSMGQQLYYSVLAHVDAMVGNSSSGLYEAPSFKKPTVNIGDRQKGRLAAASVLQTPAHADAIADAIQRALKLDCSQVVNPYGDGHSVERMMDALRRGIGSLQKSFYVKAGA
jgi:UDP-hydrolysing UDP-N-acetyl-D-glucosamine 2-epimerase